MRRRRSIEDWFMDSIITIILIVIVIVTLYPFYYILIITLNLSLIHISEPTRPY